jgi:nicotinamidase-related amidase
MEEGRTALLVIDVQAGLFQHATPVYKADELLDNICLLIERARRAHVPIFFVQHSNVKTLLYGSDGWRLHLRLQPASGDILIEKTHGSAFEDTPLKAELDARHVSRLVICGLVTHACVKDGTLAACELGYAVTLASDGHSSSSQDAARLIVEWNQKLSQRGAQLQPAREISFA